MKCKGSGGKKKKYFLPILADHKSTKTDDIDKEVNGLI